MVKHLVGWLGKVTDEIIAQTQGKRKRQSTCIMKGHSSTDRQTRVHMKIIASVQLTIASIVSVLPKVQLKGRVASS